MLKMNRTDKAKECFLEALLLDVKNYEAFDVLVTGEMMNVDEGTQPFTIALGAGFHRCCAEWEVIQTLSYSEHAREDADFVQMMYTIRLKKVRSHPRGCSL